MDLISAYFINSDIIIKAAVTITFVTVMLVVMLLITIVFLRIRLFLNHKKRNQIKSTWNPILAKVAVGQDVSISSLKKAEQYTFLILWNEYFSVVRGDSITNLKLLARKLRINDLAHRMIKSKTLHNKLLGSITLGHMREYSAWDDLILFVQDNISIVAITAVRSLLLIDPRQGIRTVLPLLITEQQWPWPSVAYALKLAGPNNICAPLSEITQRVNSNAQVRLLRYLEAINCDVITEGVINVLKTTNDPKVASVCLNIVQDVNALELVRGYVNHPIWYLRMHAARALGKIGNEDDIPRLIELLSDSGWWVRYRSAQAIANIVSSNKDTIRNLRDQVNDEFGRDMLNQVIAEIRDY